MLILLFVGVVTLLLTSFAVWLGIMSARVTSEDQFRGMVARANTFQIKLRRWTGYTLMIITLLAIIGGSLGGHH